MRKQIFGILTALAIVLFIHGAAFAVEDLQVIDGMGGGTDNSVTVVQPGSGDGSTQSITGIFGDRNLVAVEQAPTGDNKSSVAVGDVTVDPVAVTVTVGGSFEGSDNTAEVFQTGDGNVSTIVQPGSFDSAGVRQLGSDDKAKITQSGTGTMASDQNFAKIDQTEAVTAVQDAEITQSGKSNNASIDQTGLLAGGMALPNMADITQTGDGNMALISQTGGGYTSSIDVTGDGNKNISCQGSPACSFPSLTLPLIFP